MLCQPGDQTIKISSNNSNGPTPTPMQLQKACAGKTAASGGLNKDELLSYLMSIGIPVPAGATCAMVCALLNQPASTIYQQHLQHLQHQQHQQPPSRRNL